MAIEDVTFTIDPYNYGKPLQLNGNANNTWDKQMQFKSKQNIELNIESKQNIKSLFWQEIVRTTIDKPPQLNWENDIKLSYT